MQYNQEFSVIDDQVGIIGNKILFLWILSMCKYNHLAPELNIKPGRLHSGPGCSKLTTLLVNVSLKFQTLISRIHLYFLLKKSEKLLHCKSFSHFFSKKYQCIWS